MRVHAGDRAAAEAEIAEIVRWRRENQPGGQNAGSVFVNPVPGEVSAGLLIDGLGLRGLRVGTAWVSEKHANFIQASDGGSADDVRAVIELVRARVAEATGVELRSEVRLVGFEDGVTEPDAEDETRSATRHADVLDELHAAFGSRPPDAASADAVARQPATPPQDRHRSGRRDRRRRSSPSRWCRRPPADRSGALDVKRSVRPSRKPSGSPPREGRQADGQAGTKAAKKAPPDKSRHQPEVDVAATVRNGRRHRCSNH